MKNKKTLIFFLSIFSVFQNVFAAALTDTGSKVGIGTDSPATVLNVLGDNNDGTPILRLERGNQIPSRLEFTYRSLQQTNSSNLPVDMVLNAKGGNVGIGTNTPTAKLDVNGTIVANEVNVALTRPAPDYVFAPNYNLMPLKKLETHVNTQRHLPGIPSAKEIAKNGIAVGDMQARLLEKVEELTLYILQQNKQIQAQSARIKKLESATRR